jgi:hypothetical protein
VHTAPKKENSQRKKTGVPHPTNQPLLDSKAAVLNWTPRSVTTSPIHIQPATVDLLFAATDSKRKHHGKTKGKIAVIMGAIHWLVGASLFFLGLIIAFLVTGLELRSNARWRGWAHIPLLSSIRCS